MVVAEPGAGDGGEPDLGDAFELYQGCRREPEEDLLEEVGVAGDELRSRSHGVTGKRFVMTDNERASKGQLLTKNKAHSSRILYNTKLLTPNV